LLSAISGAASGVLELFTFEDSRGRRKLNSIGVLLLLGTASVATLLSYERYRRAASWVAEVDRHMVASQGYIAQIKDLSGEMQDREEQQDTQQRSLERIERKMDAMLLRGGISPQSIQ